MDSITQTVSYRRGRVFMRIDDLTAYVVETSNDTGGRGLLWVECDRHLGPRIIRAEMFRWEYPMYDRRNNFVDRRDTSSERFAA